MVIAARGLKVTDTWHPEPKSPKVGDAFTRTVAVTAADVPGMVFPPLRFDAIDGLAVYPERPAVNDRTERGTLTGERVETVNYVCERPGAVTVPDRTLTWWDLDAKELRTVKLPGRTFEVAPDPNAPSDGSPTPPATAGSGWWWVLPAVGGVLVLAWLLLARVRPWLIGRRDARAESEPAYFARFRRACRSADPHVVYTALLGWLDRFAPTTTIGEFAARAGDPELADLLTDLNARVYTRPDPIRPGPWQPARELFSRVAATRNRLRLVRVPSGVATALPPLNPRGSHA
jgi:hypothetical protein